MPDSVCPAFVKCLSKRILNKRTRE